MDEELQAPNPRLLRTSSSQATPGFPHPTPYHETDSWPESDSLRPERTPGSFPGVTAPTSPAAMVQRRLGSSRATVEWGDVLELQGLTRRHGDVVARDGLSFTAREGQMLGFVGPNGAGTTTAMRIILGCWRPTPAKSDGPDTDDGRDVQTRRTQAPGPRPNVFSDGALLIGSGQPIADDRRTSRSGRPAHRAAGLWSTWPHRPLG
jgi:ABC transporter